MPGGDLGVLYKDVELSREAAGDVAEQELALVAHGDVADGAGDAESLGFPLLQALAELGFFPRAGVHGRPQRRQLLHDRAPDSTGAAGDEGRLAVERPSCRTAAYGVLRGHVL